MAELLEKRVKEMRESLKNKLERIDSLKKEVTDIENELMVIYNTDCAHENIKKIQASSGLYVVQTIICKDCDIMIYQATGTSLFDPYNGADEKYARGN